MNSGALVLLVLVLAGLVLWAGARLWRARRRKRLRTQPLSPARRAVVEQRFPLYGRMPAALRARLDGLINQFLAEKTFYGAESLEVTEEIRTLIAAQACFIIVGRPQLWYDTLETIHVFPAAFHRQVRRQFGHLVTEHDAAHGGESYQRGPIILSWADAAAGAADPADGRNLVFHEFAHQLDQQTGVVDGAPLLAKGHDAGDWARVMQDAYGRMIEDLKGGRRPVLDPYGATAPAEFFAVATEHFFEQPALVKHKEPAMYDQLAKYYGLDPASWT